MKSKFSFENIGVSPTNDEKSMLKAVYSFKCFEGKVIKYRHKSVSCKVDMTFTIFRPPNCDTKFPALIFLAGMTDNDNSFIQQAGATKRASELGLMLVCPDTSPQNTGIEGEDDLFNICSSAGFYVDATTSKWKQNHQMYTYIVDELYTILLNELNVDSSRISISGHSMGGNAALIMMLRNPVLFKSCSAFSPICHPSGNKWGEQLFQVYLGEDKSTWHAYDAVKLLEKNNGILPVPAMVDQGTRDYLRLNEDALTTHLFVEAAQYSESLGGYPLIYNTREGYDHFYFFIQTFINNHLDFHAKYLGCLCNLQI